jgi:NADH:ubiquinone oxidoreductase subunit E
MSDKPGLLRVCDNMRYGTAASCAGRGAEKLIDKLRQEIARQELNVDVETSVCFGQCDKGPNVKVIPGGRFVHEMKEDDIPELLAQFKKK